MKHFNDKPTPVLELSSLNVPNDSCMSSCDEDSYIIPTKENPVFKVYCEWYGCYLDGIYKNFNVGEYIGDTYALNLSDCMQFLFDFIKENPESDKGFEVYMVDGSWDKKRDLMKDKLVFKLRPGEAKKYRIIL